MAINKVVYGNNVLVDLTNDTVSPENLQSGATAHSRSGALIRGTADMGGAAPCTVIVANSFNTAIDYAIDDYCLYNGGLYRFVTAHTAGAWNSSHVIQVTESSDLNYRKLNSKLQNVVAFHDGFVKNDGTLYTGSSLYHYSDKIRVKPGDEIEYYNLRGSSDALLIAAYPTIDDQNAIVADSLLGTDTYASGKYVVPAGRNFIRITSSYKEGGYIYVNKRAESKIIEKSLEVQNISKTVNTGFIGYPNGAINASSTSTYFYTDKIRVEPGDAYKYTLNGSVNVYVISAYNAIDDELPIINNCIRGVSTNTVSGIYVVPENVYFLRFCFSQYMANEFYKLGKIEDLDNTNIVNNMLGVPDSAKDTVIPDSREFGYFYRWSTKSKFATSNPRNLSKVIIDPNVLYYYVTTQIQVPTEDFPLIMYFDSEDQAISYEYMNVGSTLTKITNKRLIIPNNASYFYINSDSSSYPEIKAVYKNNGKHKPKEFRILFIGNSVQQDAVAYLPYLLKTYCPEINFKIYLWYNSGRDLNAQYTNYFAPDNPCDIFSVAENTAVWTNYNNTMKMSQICTNYQFDIVCMQEYFNYKNSYTESDLQYWNNCQEYIRSHYTGGNGLKFVTLIHPPKRDNADNIFTLAKSAMGLILKNTMAEDLFPTGIALYRALSTELNNLGDAGGLSNDRTHAQEGLPCLLQTYTILLWIYDHLGIPKSIYGLPSKMTTDIYNTLSIPGANLGTGVVEGTASENILAQQVAIQAYKESKQFVMQNIYSAQ